MDGKEIVKEVPFKRLLCSSQIVEKALVLAFDLHHCSDERGVQYSSPRQIFRMAYLLLWRQTLIKSNGLFHAEKTDSRGRRCTPFSHVAAVNFLLQLSCAGGILYLDSKSGVPGVMLSTAQADSLIWKESWLICNAATRVSSDTEATLNDSPIVVSVLDNS